MRAIAGLLVVTCLGCGGTSARRTMHRSELVIAGGLLGFLATSVVYNIDQQAEHTIVPIMIGWGAVVVGALAVYLHAAMTEQDPPSSMAVQQADTEAWKYTERAETAARAGDCATVLKISPAVLHLDPDFHAKVFVRDAGIKRCLDNH